VQASPLANTAVTIFKGCLPHISSPGRFEWLILLAMGFVGPKKAGLLEQAAVELTGRGNVAANTDDWRTSVPGVFACGDMRRGQSLVVWAIREGRQAARAVDEALMGVSELPR